MKTQKIGTEIGVGRKLEPLRAKSVSGSSFAKILEGKVAPSAPPSASFDVSPASEVGRAVPAVRLEGLALTEDSLGLLEAYGRALGDLEVRAGDLEPFVSRLEDNAAALEEVLARTPANDPLAKLLDQVAAVLAVETAKYRRGDFDA